MAETTVGSQVFVPRPAGRTKFLIGGLLIIGAVVFLVVTNLANTRQFFYTIDEIKAQGSSVVGKNVRASGAVLGDTITFDPATLTITFDVVHISNDTAELDDEGGLAAALHAAVTNPNANRLTVVYVGPMPDLLKDEAQAIFTGKIGEDGIFHAEELLLKCPTRYEEALPEQVQG